MKVLLTGANGFLGTEIRSHLHSLYSFTTLGRSDADYNVDLSTDEPIFKEEFELVIHAAGLAHLMLNSKFISDKMLNVNLDGTKRLLKALSENPPKSFIFISSIAVYGASSGFLIDESHPLAATDPYGFSKIKAEEFVAEWCASHGVKLCILRLPLVIGFSAPGNLKSMVNGIEKGYYFNIGGGKARKSMVLAKDVAEIIPRAADIGGIYNLTDGYHPSLLELGNLIAHQLRKKKPLNLPNWLANVLARIGDLFGDSFFYNSSKFKKLTLELTFSDLKARNNLNWQPTSVLDGFKIPTG